MLILVGVTINVALNGELFTQAQTAVTETEKQSIYEQIVMGMKLDGGKIDVEETFKEAQDTLSKYTVNKTSNGTNYIVLTVKGKNGTYTYTITNEKIIIGEEIPQKDVLEIGQVMNQSGQALQVGDFISYNNEIWVVFYNDDENGLQIISQNAKPGIELSGKDDYNNAISLLNKECEKYMATGAEYARIAGTIPKFYIEGDTTEIDELGMVKGIDDNEASNYEDYSPFHSLMLAGKLSLQYKIILGVRVYDDFDDYRDYQLSLMNNEDYFIGSIALCQVDKNSKYVISNDLIERIHHTYVVDSTASYGILPIILMNKNIQIIEGDGSIDTPYEYTFTNN